MDFKNLVDDEAILRSLSPNLRKTFLKERLQYNLTFGGGKRIFPIIIPIPKFHIRVMQRGYSLTLPPQPTEVVEIEYYGRVNRKPADHELMRNFFENRNYGLFTDVGQKWLYLNYFQEFKRKDILYCTIIANITNTTHQERYMRRFYYRLAKHIELGDEERENEEFNEPLPEKNRIPNIMGIQKARPDIIITGKY